MNRQELEQSLNNPANDAATKAANVKTFVAEAGAGADLSRLDLSGLNLDNTNLRGVNLAGANLRGTQLQQCNLQSANLEGADLRAAKLNNSNLGGANMSRSNMEGTDCYCAKMSSMTELTGANLRNADLRGVTDQRGEDMNVARVPLHKARNFEQAQGVDTVKMLQNARNDLKLMMNVRQTEFEEQNKIQRHQDLDRKFDKMFDDCGLSSVREMNQARERLLRRGDDLFKVEKSLFRGDTAKVDEKALKRELALAKEQVGRQVINEEEQLAAQAAPAAQHSSSSSSSRRVMDDLPGRAGVGVGAGGMAQQAGGWKSGVKPASPRGRGPGGGPG